MKIPAVIVKYLMYNEGKNKINIYDKWAYLIRSACGDEYYLTDMLVSDKVLSEEFGEEVFEAVTKHSQEEVVKWLLAVGIPKEENK